MNKELRKQQDHNLQIYPAYCFTSSPTYNKWVKLTAVDTHALRREPGFEGMRRNRYCRNMTSADIGYSTEHLLPSQSSYSLCLSMRCDHRDRVHQKLIHCFNPG